MISALKSVSQSPRKSTGQIFHAALSIDLMQNHNSVGVIWKSVAKAELREIAHSYVILEIPELKLLRCLRTIMFTVNTLQMQNT